MGMETTHDGIEEQVIKWLSLGKCGKKQYVKIDEFQIRNSKHCQKNGITTNCLGLKILKITHANWWKKYLPKQF